MLTMPAQNSSYNFPSNIFLSSCSIPEVFSKGCFFEKKRCILNGLFKQAPGMYGLRMLFQASECPKNNCSLVLFLSCSNLQSLCTIFIDGLVLFQTMGYRRNVNKKCFT